MSWDGRTHSNTKAFIIDLPTKYNVDIRVHLGWVDADGSLDIKYRTPYSYGLKFNIDFRHFKQTDDLKQLYHSLPKRLAKLARYNGRAAANELNIRDLYDYEYDSWDGEMYRMVNRYNRDYVGREEELKDLEGAIGFLKDIVIESRPTFENQRKRKKSEEDIRLVRKWGDPRFFS